MISIAALVMPGTFAASLAPLIDAFSLLQERSARTIGGADGPTPDVRLVLLSPDGGDIRFESFGMLRIDQSISADDLFDFIWIPCFRAQGEAELRQRLSTNRPVVDWLQQAATQGATIGASGAAVVFPMAAHLTDRLRVPVATPLLPVIRALFPRFRHAGDSALVEHPGLMLTRGIAQDVQAITNAFSRIFSQETGRWINVVFGSDAMEEHPLSGRSAFDPLVESARMILEQRFTGAVSISVLATELCVSHSVLIRRFRCELNLTPSQYVQQLRLGAAQKMLRRSSRSIDSVASAIGYSDARVFREMFRKATGMTATEWRRAARSGG